MQTQGVTTGKLGTNTYTRSFDVGGKVPKAGKAFGLEEQNVVGVSTLSQIPGSSLRERLSALELAIIRGLADGMQTKELSAALGRKPPTIETHIRQLYARFDARSRAQLVARAIALEVLEMPTG